MRKRTNLAGMVNVLWACIALLVLLCSLSGCPIYDESYHVFYDGNLNTSGNAPVDSKVYFPGDMATVLDKPSDLKKRNLEFLGWRQRGNEVPLKKGERISIGYEDVWLYAWWKDDLDNNPYTYITDPGNDGGVIISSYTSYGGYESPVVIPDTLDNKPVTGIGEGAFSNLYISGVKLPSHLKTIGDKAFAETWLDKLVIPDTVVSIGGLAFQNSRISSLTIGSGLTSIGDYAFDGNRLTALFLPESVNSIRKGAFYNNAIVSVEIGSNVAIENGSAMGTNGASFLSFYTDKGKQAGVYLFNNDKWNGPYTD
ncbi:MAG: leucine-rich repeat domain-containing protein [Treponema sp.]|nr:leucine-rich repeat domain-containing protein [Treponema sp.]